MLPSGCALEHDRHACGFCTGRNGDEAGGRCGARHRARRGGFWAYVAGTAHKLCTEHVLDGGLRIDNYHTTLPFKKGLSSSAAVCVMVPRPRHPPPRDDIRVPGNAFDVSRCTGILIGWRSRWDIHDACGQFAMLRSQLLSAASPIARLGPGSATCLC